MLPLCFSLPFPVSLSIHCPQLGGDHRHRQPGQPPPGRHRRPHQRRLPQRPRRAQDFGRGRCQDPSLRLHFSRSPGQLFSLLDSSSPRFCQNFQNFCFLPSPPPPPPPPPGILSHGELRLFIRKRPTFFHAGSGGVGDQCEPLCI